MKAKELVKKFGKKLIGTTVITDKVGFWEGGECTILDLFPEKEDKNIVLLVQRIKDQEEIGVFSWENIVIP